MVSSPIKYRVIYLPCFCTCQLHSAVSFVGVIIGMWANLSEMVCKKCSNLKCNLYNTKHPTLFKINGANNGYPLPAFIDEAKLASAYDLHLQTSSENSIRFRNPFRVCRNCYEKTSNWDSEFYQFVTDDASDVLLPGTNHVLIFSDILLFFSFFQLIFYC